MALYQKIVITDAGAALMSRILTSGGDPLTFEAIAIGSGELPADANQAAFTGLISELKRLPIETVTNDGGRITVTARLATDTLTADLYHREIGVYANGVLLAYGNTGAQYDYIPAAGKNAAVQKIIRVPLAIGTMQTAFAEMDTSDLVTYAGLEARVAKIVEPIVRENISVEIVEESLDDAVREVANELTEAIISAAVDKALFESGEYHTGAGTQDLTARCFEIAKPVCGRVERIEIPCRSTTNVYDRMFKGKPVYLSIFEQTTSGEWVHIGISTNCNTQTAGATAIWEFDNLKLSGRPVRFIVVTARANTAFDTSLYMGARVTASTAGAAYEESSLATPQNYLADVTFAGASLKEKYARETEETVATGWAWIYAFPGAGGDYLMTIAGANIYTPDTSGTTTDAERLQIYVDRINAAQPYVTASAASTPAELGSGGYFFILTATKPGAVGNVKLSGNTAAVRFSGDTLTGGQDAVFAHVENGACHVSQHDRAKWDTPLNAYQLYKGQQITAIPGDADLTKTLFAYQMCWDCKHLSSISGLQMPCVMNAYGAFYGCAALTDISGTSFSLSLNCAYMFANCTSLQTLGDANFAGAENCGAMFLNCSNLTSTGTSTFRQLKFAESMFSGCIKLEDITSMRLDLLSYAQSMFGNCILNLESVKHIAQKINVVAKSVITIGINAELQGNTELAAALETIRGKGWTIIEEYNTKTA